MNKKEYLQIVKKYTPKENNIRDYFLAFLSGGLIGFIGEAIRLILINRFSIVNDDAISIVLICAISISAVLTGTGKFDNLINRCKAGIVIPITGFAHSLTASILDYKHDGLITGIGANIFKLAGSVIMYAIISGFIFGVIRVIINV